MTTTTTPANTTPATTAPAVPEGHVSLTIDGQRVVAKKGTLLVEAAKQINVDVPVFCYHDRLKPVGACRMCLVEIEKMPRLQTACTTPVAEGMIVKTESQMAKEGRGSVVSLLLANHPLDCPVCDKGGECPLQDNAFGHGEGVSKFTEDKKHNDKAFELSERIVLDRERCILCYRCVRFHEEIPGDRALAVLDRGAHGEIGVLEGDVYDSPFQGNTIDICPVGALTSRQYRFRSRPWDLRHTAGIACDDPVGSHVEVDTRDGRVVRVRGRTSDATCRELNDGWISDRTRFDSVPAERTERLQQPLVRTSTGWKASTWEEALRAAGNLLRNQAVGVVVSPAQTNEAYGVIATGAFGDGVQVLPTSSSMVPVGSIAALGKSKSIVVVGFDPWSEVPMLALTIRRAVANTAAGPGGASLVVMHEHNGLFRDTAHWWKTTPSTLLSSLRELLAALKGTGGSDDAKKAALALQQKPASLLCGPDIANHAEARVVLDEIGALLGPDGLVGAPTWHANGRGAQLMLQPRAVNQTSAMIIVGDTPPTAAAPKMDAHGLACLVPTRAPGRSVWLTSSLAAQPQRIPDHVDVVLPIAHLYEQAGSLTNLEGRVQGFSAAGMPPGTPEQGARADWDALLALANELGTSLPREFKALRAHLVKSHPLLANIPVNRAKPRLELSIV
jgi:NADH-quinone oxidoreductase subunit G